MKDQELLRYAANEIRDLRNTVSKQAAQLEIVDIFAAALGMKKQHKGGVSPDIVAELESKAYQIEDEASRNSDH